jgi:hypothetical protein
MPGAAGGPAAPPRKAPAARSGARRKRPQRAPPAAAEAQARRGWGAADSTTAATHAPPLPVPPRSLGGAASFSLWATHGDAVASADTAVMQQQQQQQQQQLWPCPVPLGLPPLPGPLPAPAHEALLQALTAPPPSDLLRRELSPAACGFVLQVSMPQLVAAAMAEPLAPLATMDVNVRLTFVCALAARLSSQR